MILSILVPTYEGSSRIPHLIESLNSMGYLNNLNCEIIVSDNGSSIDCSKYIRDLCELHAISFLGNSVNLGFSANCMRLLFRARGRFTWIIGDDDVVHIHASSLLPLLGAANENSILVCQEDYDYIVSNMVSPNIPFGYISNVIQPNSSKFIFSMFEYSFANSGHNSPQFFARWELFNELGPGSLMLLPGSISSRAQGSRSARSMPGYFRLLYLCYRAFVSIDVSWNWYCAYRNTSSLQNFSVPGQKIKSSFIDILASDFRRAPFEFCLINLFKLPRMLLKDIGYGAFYFKVIISSLSFSASHR